MSHSQSGWRPLRIAAYSSSFLWCKLVYTRKTNECMLVDGSLISWNLRWLFDLLKVSGDWGLNLSRRFWVKNFVDFSLAQSQTKFTRVPFHPTVGLRAAPWVLCIVAIFSVSSASSIKAGYGLPTAATLTTLDTLDRMRTWCRCSVQTWQAVDNSSGSSARCELAGNAASQFLEGWPIRHWACQT